MRRAVPFLFVTLALILPGVSRAQRVERPADIIDGAGMVNFMQRPTFKIGSWVKYRTVSSSEQGFNDDYTVTILIGGEEVWWGEPCFWVETWIKKPNDRERQTASLVSYSAFGDSMSDQHILWFIRKTINGMKPSGGGPDIALYTRGKTEVQLRREIWEKDNTAAKVDSVGSESISVPGGSFDTYKIRKHYGVAETAEQGDSTIYYERKLDRTFYMTPQVPFTHLARVDLDDWQQGKTWLAGKFDRGPLKTLERARGKTELIEYGTSGLNPVLVPAESRHSIDRKLIDATLDETAEYLSASSKPARRGAR